MLKFKSVHDPIAKNDGLRILATRFRGHGMKAGRYHVWMPSLGPSERLLKEMMAGDLAWKDFSKAFKEEILSSAEIDEKNATIRNHGHKFTLRLIRELSKKENVTLMCHCATDEKRCHLRVLERVMRGV
ncbi:MAG: DUF488 family protein [Bacteroidales bacterium]|nr:DUF488 family protein [Bacteroidales bacterium]